MRKASNHGKRFPVPQSASTRALKIGQGHGSLKYGNPSGDLTTVARCGARTRRGTACQAPAMRNGRCRMHGGLSTGPRTPEGLERSRRARWKHGAYSEDARNERRRLKAECAAFNAAADALLRQAGNALLMKRFLKRNR